MCLRDLQPLGTCRGTPTKLIPVNLAEWVIPPRKVQRYSFNTDGWTSEDDGDGLVLSAFGDTDNDGDIDMLGIVCTGPATQTYSPECRASIFFYENIADPTTGTGAPNWQIRAPSYSKADTSGIDSIQNFHFNEGVSSQVRGAASLSLVDVDQDGDLDIIFHCSSISPYLKNVGSSTSARWVVSTSPFPSSMTGSGKGFALGDLDDDGDLDAVVHSSDWSAAGVSYFQNIGTNESPNYVDRGDIGGMLLSVSNVVMVDVDRDGDIDILVSGLRNDGSIKILLNTGTKIEAEWSYIASTEKTLDFLGLDSDLADITTSQGGLTYLSQIVDMDSDGMLDFVYNTNAWQGGRMKFFKRVKAIGKHHFNQQINWGLGGDGFTDGFQSPIAVFGVDLNGDGRKDVVVGRYGGDQQAGTWFFENLGIGDDGVKYAAKVELLDSTGNPIRGEEEGGHSRPVFLDIGDDGVFDLIVGTMKSSSGQSCWYYENVGTSTSWSFVRRESWGAPSAIADYDEQTQKCHIALGDMDGDGKLDVIKGVRSWYKRTSNEMTLVKQTSSTNSRGLPDINWSGD